MRAVLGSSPRTIAALGEELGAAPVSNIPRPPGVSAPKSAGADAVKLAVLRDAQGSAEFLVATLVTLPQSLVALVAISIDLIRSGAGLVAVGGATIFVVSRLASLRASRGVSKATAALQATDARVFSEIGEKMGHVEDFRLAGAKGAAASEVDAALDDAVRARKGLARALALSSQVTTVLGAMAPLLVLLVLTAMGHPPRAGEVAKLLLAIPVLVARLQAIDALRVGSIEKAVVLRAVTRVLALAPRPDPARAKVGHDAVTGARVAFSEVTFVPEGKKEAILHGVSLDIPAGAVVGLCGPSGSGKSTLLRLLLRLDDPTGGSVAVDGVDVRELLVDDLPRVFSRLGQESKLLPRSIEENVLLGAPLAVRVTKTAEDALRRAQIAELATPDGLARRFVPAPPNLSGGEQRRVLFARALAQDAKVLVLDEPEAGLPGGASRRRSRSRRRCVEGKNRVHRDARARFARVDVQRAPRRRKARRPRHARRAPRPIRAVQAAFLAETGNAGPGERRRSLRIGSIRSGNRVSYVTVPSVSRGKPRESGANLV